MNIKLRQNLPGFTLIELAVVLIIIGIIAGAVLKGQDLLEAAKIRSILTDINRYRSVIALYQETYGALPGDDPNAQAHFGDGITPGNGDGVIAGDEVKHFWLHLAKAGHLSGTTPPTTRFGGNITVAYNYSDAFPGHWLLIAGPNSAGMLTPVQARALKSKADDGPPNTGLIRFATGSNDGGYSCLRAEDAFNTTHSRSTCIILVPFP